jgi:hypothetical protein
MTALEKAPSTFGCARVPLRSNANSLDAVRIPAMTDSDFPEPLLRFLESCIPNFSAVELLVFLAGHADTPWSSDEIVRAIQPVVITGPAVEEYLALFKAKGLVKDMPDARFQFAPASTELAEAVAALSHAYNERPVSLIRTIYAFADSRIRSFADTFKLNTD